MPEHAVALLAQGGEAERDDALARFAEVLDGEVPAPEPDTGLLEVRVEAEDEDEAIGIVRDAIADAGADDWLVIAEHE